MLDLSDDIIEKLLLKKVLTDRTYAMMLSRIFDIRWVQNKDIAVALDAEVGYFRKYDRIANKDLVVEILKKYASVDYFGMNGDPREHRRNFYPDMDPGTVKSTIFDAVKTNLEIDEKAVSDNIREYLKGRALYHSIFDNVNEMERTKSVDKCLETFERFQKMSFDEKNLGLQYFRKEDQEKHWNYILNPEAKIRTGWETLDDTTNGGILKDGKFLGIFCGQAGLGKSLFLSNLAVNLMMENKRVVVISLEMSEDVYAQRFDAHISTDNINRLKETHEQSLAKIKQFYEEHQSANLIIKEFPPRTIRVAEIDDYLLLLKSEGLEFDCVVVDYLNLVLPNTKIDNMYQSVLTVAEQLRALSYKHKVPFVSASQVNRDGINSETVGLENISESGGIAHTVDFCGMLFQTDADRQNAIIQMRIAKNRLGGKVGMSIPFHFDENNLVLKDVGFGSGVRSSPSEADNIVSNLSNDTDSI